MSKNATIYPYVASMTFDPDQPYNDLPALPPAGETRDEAVLKKSASSGERACGLQQAAELIPNQEVLINSIPLREAKDSSAIENIVTTNDRLFRFANADADQADPATKETLRYRTALLRRLSDSLEAPAADDANSNRPSAERSRASNSTSAARPGTKLSSNQTGKVIYTPPEGEALLREQDVELGALPPRRASDLDPLIRMAVAHYQFEAIHPFPDGNGRTGRILNILFLIEQGLLDLPILYLSRYINAASGRLLSIAARGDEPRAPGSRGFSICWKPSRTRRRGRERKSRQSNC